MSNKSSNLNPILHPQPREHQNEDNFTASELRLANRNSGIHLEVLRHDVTPVGMHYLLSHFDIPFVENESDWSLSLTGLLDSEREFNLEQLRALPKVMRTVTLECAGNGRVLMQPRWQSMPWNCEAVGTATWGGTLLSDVLALVKPKPGVTELVFSGSDEGVDGGKIHAFERSLTLAQIAECDVMLAWVMNGQALPPQHGFPLRLVVPGWFGMASVKWLREIRFSDLPFKGHQQVGTYRYRRSENDEGVAVTNLRVKSLMIPPGIPDFYTRRRLVQPGAVALRGRAWSGAARSIRQVEVAIQRVNDESSVADENRVDEKNLQALEWQTASIERPMDTYAWSAWHLDWQAMPGYYRLYCRATDENGESQPLEAPWDRAGFGNNAVQCINVWVDQ